MRRMGRGLLELRRWAPGFYSLPKERLMGGREGGRGSELRVRQKQSLGHTPHFCPKDTASNPTRSGLKEVSEEVEKDRPP